MNLCKNCRFCFRERCFAPEGGIMDFTCSRDSHYPSNCSSVRGYDNPECEYYQEGEMNFCGDCRYNKEEHCTHPEISKGTINYVTGEEGYLPINKARGMHDPYCPHWAFWAGDPEDLCETGENNLIARIKEWWDNF